MTTTGEAALRIVSLGERVLPHSLEAERSVLGAVLANNDALSVATRILDGRDFYRDAHRRVFERMVGLSDRGQPIDLVTLREELSRSGEIEHVGGPAYVAQLVDGMPRTANVEYYCRIVKEKARLRAIIQAGQRFVARAYHGDSPPGELVNEAFDSIAGALESDAAPARRTAIEMIDDVALVNRPAPIQAIEGRIADQSFVMLLGESGAGKSTTALGLGFSWCTAVGWLGAAVLRSGTVIYVCGEGQSGTARRIAAQKVAHHLRPESPIGLHVVPQAVNLFDPVQIGAFLRVAAPVGPVAVFFDTLSRCSVGADENSAKDAAIIVGQIDRIKAELGATVVLPHHFRKDGQSERGSSVFRAAADTVMELKKGDDLLTLSCTKQKDAPEFSDIRLRMTEVPGTGACIMRRAEDVVDTGELSDAQGKVLHVLSEFFGSDGGTTQAWLKVSLEQARVSESSFWRAKTVLSDRGFIEERGQRFIALARTIPR